MMTPPEVDEILTRAKRKLVALMMARESGTIVIGYANGSLRLETHSHEPPIKVDAAMSSINESRRDGAE